MIKAFFIFAFLLAISSCTSTKSHPGQITEKNETSNLSNMTEYQIDSLITLFPNWHRPYAIRATQYLRNNKLKLSLNDINIALELSPYQATYHRFKAAILYGLGHFEKALTSTHSGLAIKSQDPDLLMLKIELHMALNEGDYALRTAKKLILIAPKQPYIQLYTSELIFKEEHDTSLALQYMDNHVQQNPFDARAYSKRGSFYQEINNQALSEQDFKTALSLDSNNIPANIAQLNKFFPNLNDSQLTQEINKLTQRDTSTALLVQLAKKLNQQKKYKLAIHYYKKALIKNPSNSFIIKNIAYTYVNSKLFKNALNFIDTLYNQRKNKLEKAKMRYYVFKKSDNIPAQKQEILSVLEIEPNNSKFLYRYAYHEYQHGDSEKAEKLFDKMYHLDPQNPLNSVNYIEFKLLLNRFAEVHDAIEYYIDANSNSPYMAFVFYLQAIMLEVESKDSQYAIKNMRKLMETPPTVGWSFHHTDEWLKHKSLPPERDVKITEITNEVSKWAQKIKPKENPTNTQN